MSAADLLARAVTLLAENDAVRRDALLDLADARRETGENLSALKAYDEALEAARAASDEVRATRAVLGQLEVGSDFDLERFLAEGPTAVARGLEVFERLGDDLNLANTWRLRAFIEAAVGRSTTAQDAATRAITFAQRAGDERLEARNLSMHCYILDWGPAHVAEVRQRSQQALDWAKRRGVRGLEKDASNILARATAMQGDFERSREFLTAVRSIKVDVSDPLFSVSDTLTAASVELLDNQPGAAEELLRRGGADPREPGELRPHPIVLTLLARALLSLGRYEEAERLTRRCQEVAAPSQLDAQIKWRELRAVALAHQGDLINAERWAKEAVEFAERSEQPDSQAQAFADLAEVLQVAGRSNEAVEPLQRALDLYQRKGNVVMAERTQSLLASFERA